MLSKIPGFRRSRMPVLLAALALLLAAGLPLASTAQPIEVRLPAVNGQVNETVDIDIKVDNITGEQIAAYQFTLPYDASVLSITGEEVQGTVTASTSASVIVNTQNEGEVTVAVAGSQAFSGQGTLLTLKADLVGSGTAGLSFSELRFDDINVEEVPTSQRAGRVSVATESDTKTVDANGSVEFGSTGIDVNFSGVSGSGDVTVSKFDSPAFGTGTISESNVSSFRFLVESSGDLSFDSNTEIRLDVGTLQGVSNPEDVTIYKRDEGGEEFTALSTSFDADANVLVATVGSFSEFVLASDSDPLPVEMASFEAVRDDGTVRLRWSTASETNNSGFTVQHQSSSGWADLGFVEGHGTTTQPRSYSFSVDALEPGTHRFRLEQVDVDGTTELSDVVSVTLPMQDVLRLTAPAPNPVSSETQFRFGVREQMDVTVAVYNVRGQRVTTLYEGTPAPGEMQAVRFNAQRYASGTYFVRVTSGTHTRTQRVTVVK